MQIEDSGRADCEDTVDDSVPWTAGDLSSLTSVRCKDCGNMFLATPAPEDHPGSGWTWKDLPSGNWAEMMDFWHCHKPDPPEGHHPGGQEEVKGYGAANRVVATRGTVLVDVPSFLVSGADCVGLKVRICLFSFLVLFFLFFSGKKKEASSSL